MQRGQHMTEEQRANLRAKRAVQVMLPWTPEQRARHSLSMAGNKNGQGAVPSPEKREKLRRATLGSQRALGAKRTPEQRERHRRGALNAVTIGECAYCLAPATTEDHVIPTCRGGAKGIENQVFACNRCNDSKGCRTPEEWLANGLYGSHNRQLHGQPLIVVAA